MLETWWGGPVDTIFSVFLYLIDSTFNSWTVCYTRLTDWFSDNLKSILFWNQKWKTWFSSQTGHVLSGGRIHRNLLDWSNRRQ